MQNNQKKEINKYCWPCRIAVPDDIKNKLSFGAYIILQQPQIPLNQKFIILMCEIKYNASVKFYSPGTWGASSDILAPKVMLPEDCVNIVGLFKFSDILRNLASIRSPLLIWFRNLFSLYCKH